MSPTPGAESGSGSGGGEQQKKGKMKRMFNWMTKICAGNNTNYEEENTDLASSHVRVMSAPKKQPGVGTSMEEQRLKQMRLETEREMRAGAAA